MNIISLINKAGRAKPISPQKVRAPRPLLNPARNAKLFMDYFLKRASNASRALVTLLADVVSRSIAFWGLKLEQEFRTFFFGMRSGMGCVHS